MTLAVAAAVAAAAPLAAVPLAIDLTAALTGVADPGDASLLAAAPVVHCPA